MVGFVKVYILLRRYGTGQFLVMYSIKSKLFSNRNSKVLTCKEENITF